MNQMFNLSLEMTPEITLNLRLNPILMTTIVVASTPNRHLIIIAVRRQIPATTLFRRDPSGLMLPEPFLAPTTSPETERRQTTVVITKTSTNTATVPSQETQSLNLT